MSLVGKNETFLMSVLLERCSFAIETIIKLSPDVQAETPQTFHLVLFAAEEVENNIKAAAGQLDKQLNLHAKLCRQPELQIQLIIFCSQRRLPPSEHQIMIMMSHNEPHERNTRTNVHVQSVFADLAPSWQRNTKLPVTPWGGTIEETLTSASDVWQV